MDTESDPLLHRKNSDVHKQSNVPPAEYASADSYTSGGRDLSETSNSSTTGTFNIFTKPTVLGVSMIYVVFGLYTMAASSRETIIFRKACETNMVDGVCDRVQNQLLVSSYEQARSFTTKVVSLLALSVVGKISDTYGRKPLFVFFAVCMIIRMYGFFVLTYWPYGLQYKSLLLAEILGAFGSSTAELHSIISAYISDVTPMETRKGSMSFSLSFLFASQTIGSLLGTLLLGYGKSRGLPREKNDFLPVYGNMVLTLLLMVYVMFLPESLDKNTLREFEPIKWKVPSPGDIRRVAVKTYSQAVDQMRLLKLPEEYIPMTMKHRITEMRWSVFILVAISSVIMVCADGVGPIVIQYVIYKFEWDSQLISEYLMSVATAAFFSLAVVFPFVSTYLLPKVFKMQYKPHEIDSLDYATLAMGLLSEFCCFISLALSRSTVQTFVLVCIFSYGGSILPCVNSCITKFYPQNRTAEVYMAMSIISNLLGTVVPSAWLWLYKFTIKHQVPELTFFTVSAMSGGCLVALFALFVHRKTGSGV